VKKRCGHLPKVAHSWVGLTWTSAEVIDHDEFIRMLFYAICTTVGTSRQPKILRLD